MVLTTECEIYMVHCYCFNSVAKSTVCGISFCREEAFFDLQLNVKGNKSCKLFLNVIYVLITCTCTCINYNNWY